MVGSSNAAGFTLLETLVALFLTAVAVLAAAPMFIHASHANDAGAAMGTVGSLALDRQEQLAHEKWRDLDAGGSLTSDVAGYYDDSDPDYLTRWIISDNVTPSSSKTITVLTTARGSQLGPRRSVQLTTIRGR